MSKEELKNIQDKMGLTPEVVGAAFKKVDPEKIERNKLAVKVVKKYFSEKALPESFRSIFYRYRKLI